MNAEEKQQNQMLEPMGYALQIARMDSGREPVLPEREKKKKNTIPWKRWQRKPGSPGRQSIAG